MNGGGGSTVTSETIYEVFFDLEENLCQRYPALTPFTVRREKFGEVVNLLHRINSKNMRKKGVRHSDNVYTDKRGNVHIRREAKNDNWY